MTIHIPWLPSGNTFIPRKTAIDIIAKFSVVSLFVTVVTGLVVSVPVKAKMASGFTSDIGAQGEPVTSSDLGRAEGQKVAGIDEWITYYADKYSKSQEKYFHTKQLLHCLMYRESRYDTNKGHGDNGKAGGPLQYHQGTWDGYRKLMIKQGHITEIGSRYDVEQAINTTAWAINDGRAKAWGPVLRGECK
jgi:hypothetical protein